MKATWQKDGFRIRLAKASDVDDYYFQNYCPLDKGVARLTGCKEHFTKEEVTSFFLKAIEETDRYFFLIIDPNGKIIGESVINAIDWDLRRANFRISTGLNWTSFSFNLRAEKAYLRAGFKREGVLRDAVFDRGKYADDILMAILEDDWRKLTVGS
ncbi:GNAT family N-acetyltransferase [Lactobacillus delbrueckii]|uniref:GNAT family N-acetyltransferase n=1 Tax=Lactobacillus delbrueckii TaxID=1584 RepID=UPI001107B26A|nr:GNAT family protein [Lactobacillus delbrueckii]MCD5542627.1 GNAT family N-acetyltransferase [Lactobacillus delbrueckii subsp. lactis]MCT3485725.1 N-acetyltransferase [Lactobacillus delbrueckii subsp. lactis]TLQ29253.1 GNAT family N-acetyltransferase [Lactobacillus delbrueckii subsp. lactis]